MPSSKRLVRMERTHGRRGPLAIQFLVIMFGYDLPYHVMQSEHDTDRRVWRGYS